MKMLKSFILNLLSILIPKSLKRLILISTLYQKAVDDEVFDHVDYHKLNKGLNIASNCNVIQSALSVKDLVWKDVDLQKLLGSVSVCELRGERVDVCEAKVLSDQVLAAIPSWLRYDKFEMSKDLTLLFCAEPLSVSKA